MLSAVEPVDGAVGWSGRVVTWWSTDSDMHGLPDRLPGPGFRQVQDDATGRTGQPGRHTDQMRANGRGGRTGMKTAGQTAQTAGEVVRDRPQHRQAALAQKDPDGRWTRADAAASAMTCSMIA